MADDRIDVKFGATTDELKAGQDRAVGIVTQGSAQIQDRFRQMGQGAAQSMGQAQAAVQTGLTGIVSMFSSFGKIAALALGTLAGGALFKNAIDSTQEYVSAAKKLQAQLGGNVNEAAALNFAYKRVGVTSDEVRDALNKLYRQMRNDEEGFDRLGVKIRDQQGEYRKTIDVYFEALEAIKAKKEGMDRFNASADAFGMRMRNMPGLIKVVITDVENAGKFLRSLGMEIGPELEKQLRLFRAGMADAHLVMTALNFHIAGKVLPIFNMLSGWFSGEGPRTVRLFIEALKFIEWGVIWWSAAFRVMKLGAQQFGAETKIIFTSVVDYTKNIFTIGMSAANEIWAMQMQALTNTSKYYAKQIKKEIDDAKAEIDKLYATPRRLTYPPPKGGEAYPAKGADPKGAGAGPGLFQKWQEELEKIKTEENAFLDFSKAREREFWADRLAACREGSNEYAQVRRRVFQLDKEMAKDAVDLEVAQIRLRMEQEKTSWDQRLAGQDKITALMAAQYGKDTRNFSQALMEKQRLQNQYEQAMIRHQEKIIDHEKTLAMIDIDIERDKIQFQENLGAMSGARRITLEMQLAQRSYQIEKDNLQKLLIINKDHAERLKELKQQAQILDKKHSQEMIRLSQQRTLALKRDVEGFVRGAVSQFKGAVWSWISGAQTFGQAFKGMLMGLGQMFMDLIFQMIEGWILALIFGGSVANTQIGQKSGPVYMENLLALIPIVGPYAAPGAAAGLTAAEVAVAKGLSLATAAQGWDVDRDALAYVHKKEMILPPGLAEGIRGLIAGPPAVAASMIRLTVPVTTEIKADGKTLLKNHKRLVFDIVQEGIDHRVIRVKS